jgi:hypothetical protein
MVVNYEKVLFYIYVEGLWNDLGQDSLFLGWDANAGGSWMQKRSTNHNTTTVCLEKKLYLYEFIQISMKFTSQRH